MTNKFTLITVFFILSLFFSGLSFAMKYQCPKVSQLTYSGNKVSGSLHSGDVPSGYLVSQELLPGSKVVAVEKDYRTAELSIDEQGNYRVSCWYKVKTPEVNMVANLESEDMPIAKGVWSLEGETLMPMPFAHLLICTGGLQKCVLGHVSGHP